MKHIILLLILLSSSLTFAGPIEGINPFQSVKKVESTKEAGFAEKVNELQQRVSKKISQWWKQITPKSEEELAREKRVAAEKKRQQDRREALKKLKESLPEVQSQELDKYSQFVKDAESLGQKSLFLEKDGRKPTKPIVEWKGEAKVPQLDIGREPSISLQDFSVTDHAMGVDQFKQFKALPSPKPVPPQEILAWTKKQIPQIQGERQLKRQEYGLAEVVTEKKVDKVNLTMKDSVDEYKKYHNFSKNELKMLAALLINSSGKKCHVVAGLLDELSESPEFKKEANFHLGICSIKMGFYAEAVQRLLPLIAAEDPNYATQAIKELAKDLPREYEVRFAKAIHGLKNAALIPGEAHDRVSYLAAKGIYKQGKYNLSSQYALKVRESSDMYPSAQFLSAVAEYNTGRAGPAMKRLQDLKDWMESKKLDDNNLRTLTAITMARIHFQTNQFNSALKLYNQVDKNHPLWVQGLIEQGWTQVMVGDYAGAIGNMYSLHSPYFKSVYMPESWVVRTIGYINICQYGDAYNSLTRLETQYRGWHSQVKSYISNHRQAKDYYFSVLSYLKGKSTQDVDGLPYQVVRELARQRTYINYQDSINMKVDEISQYEFIYKIILEDKNALRARMLKAQERRTQIIANIKKSEEDKSLLKNLAEWNRQRNFESQLIRKLKFQLSAYEGGRRSFKGMQQRAKKRLDREIYALRESAGRNLVKSLQDIGEQIGKTLDNNEFLRYEVYAGSGENIRYMVASGGETGGGGQRVKASVKPPKSLNWDFQGEYWEDEIGSYRSTLKNNCPEARRASASVEGG